MQPWIHQYNYISDYFNTVYKQYSSVFPAYPITYYFLDMENSVYDSDVLVAGSYEKYGVGALSGMKWNEVKLLPVYGIEQVQASHVATENGVISEDSEYTSIVMSSDHGIVPNEWDFVYFDQSFMYQNSNFDPMFVVQHIDSSSWGEFNHYKLSLKVTPADTRIRLQSQISNRFVYVDFCNSMYKSHHASMLFTLSDHMESLASILSDKIDPCGFYLETTD